MAVSSIPSDRRKVAGQRLGRYDVLYLLASGGMGSVYVGRQSGMAGFERLVAIKTLHPHLAEEDQFVNMFLDEARLAARIRHPNVVATLDISESPMDGYFLVMEYVEGENLAALLKRSVSSGAQLPVTIALRIVLDALQGLAAAHGLTERDGRRLNLVHRDVSPQNVLVGADGISRLTDFGIAKAEVNVSTTRHGQLKGKLSYMAPEQATHGKVEQRSDLFSMGIVLWEALTQKRLFRGKTNAETLHKVLISESPPPSSVRRELAPFDKILARALAKSIDERFQTAQEMIEAIESVAPKVGGIAPARAVSLLVHQLSKDKLLQESTAINDALKGIPRDNSIAVAIPIDIDEDERTPITDAPAELRASDSFPADSLWRSKRLLWMAGAAAIGIVMIGIGVWWFGRTNAMEQPATSLGTTTKALPASPAMPSTSVRSAIPSAALPEPPTHAVPSGAEKSTENSLGSHEEGDLHVDQKASAASIPEPEPDDPSLEQDSSSKPAVLRPKRVVRRSASKRKQASSSTSVPSAPASKPEEVLTNPYR